jgi:hypothetical protein
MNAAATDLLMSVRGRRFATVLADPPWRFTNKSGKVAPEHKRLARYGTMTLDAIIALPVAQVTAATARLHLWCPNALLPQGLAVLEAWGFRYKSKIVWHKVRSDGGSDRNGRAAQRRPFPDCAVRSAPGSIQATTLRRWSTADGGSFPAAQFLVSVGLSRRSILALWRSLATYSVCALRAR